jgi:hypothetical protein
MGSAMRAKPELEPSGLQLETFIKRALGGVIGDAIEAAMAVQLPRALAAIRLPARPAEESPYVSHERAAVISGYHKRTIGRHIAAGTLAATGLNGDRIERSELDRWMAAMGARARARGRRRATGPEPAPVNEADEINAEVDRLLNDDDE